MPSVELKWHEIPSARPSVEQLGFVTDLSHRNIGMFGGYGSGKTHAAAYKALVLSSINVGCTGGLVGPDFPALFEDLIPAVEMICDASGIEHVLRADYKKLDILIPAWNGRLKLASADKPKMMRGPNWAFAVGNEPGLWSLEAWRSFSSRVREPAAAFQQIALAGTPEGFNWLYEETVEKHPNAPLGLDPDWRIWFADTEHATWLDPAYVADLKAKYPSDLVDEKIHGRFVNVGASSAYSAFNRAKHVVRKAFDPNLPLSLCLDFNIAPAIAVVHQAVPHPELGKVIYALDEVMIPRGAVQEVIREFLRRWQPVLRGRVDVIGDATGASKHATGLSCYEEVFRVLKTAAVEWSNRTPAANPPVSDRVAIVNGALERGRYFVDPKCEHLIKDLEQVRYKPGTRELDKSNPLRTHLSDAAGYDLYSHFGGVGVVPSLGIVRAEAADRPWARRELPPWRT